MIKLPRIQAGERIQFATLALLLFINAIVLESNEVVATSGFVSNVGPASILWVWAVDMAIIILTSSAYSLVVDRTKREWLATGLFVGFGLVYVALYLLFALGAPDWITYTLLTVINDQQWMLFPLLIWALANDFFEIAATKRLFSILGAAALIGGIVGGGLAALVARWLVQDALGGVKLLFLNVGLLLLMAVILGTALSRIKITARQSTQAEKMIDVLREGIGFVREVPSYRYLTVAMILTGVGLNAIEYQLIVSASQAYSEPAALQAFYGTFRSARTVLLLLVQSLASSWLLNRIGFKSIFAFMPGALLTGLLLALAWPGLIGVVIGEYLVQVVLQGVDEPARRAFVGLVPDERRGRVSAFLEGYLYPLGSIIGCGTIGAVEFIVNRNLIASRAGRPIYLGLACVSSGVALWAITRFRVHYDVSMLSWRLKRRRRKSFLTGIEFEPILTPPKDE